MTKVIAALVAGVVLGTAGTALAAQQAFWSERGSGYLCEGVSSGVICKAGNYDFGATPDFVYIQHRRTDHMFGCTKRSGFAACFKGNGG